jgi:hypothetical protein
MPQDETDGDKEFKVSDRRRFSSSGESRATDVESTAATGSSVRDERDSGIGISFSGFVIGLAQQAFVALGLAENPDEPKGERDLSQAKAMIDVLAMLRDKTQGNLDEVESRMMDEVLDELRLRYVREQRAQNKE